MQQYSNKLFFYFLLAGSILMAACSPSRDEPSTQKPNIVYILADDLGYGDPGCYNPQSKIPTPHMDQLAEEGMRFTDAHSPSAVCTPTRYGILTGRYSWRTRLKSGVLWGYSRPLISEDRMTVASYLKDKGYHTGAIGKWHLGLGWGLKDPSQGLWENTDESEMQYSGENIDYTKPIEGGPTDRGFDYFYGIPASLDMDPYVYVENDKVVQHPSDRTPGSTRDSLGFWREGPISPDFTFEGVLPTITDKAVAFIENHGSHNGNQPFFLYFPLNAPHTPWVPVDEVRGTTNVGKYGDFVYQVDQTVGKVLEALEKQGLKENTLIIFTSDNGSHEDHIPEASGHDANGPLKGQKADIWEGGHRVPFVARWPGHIPAGSLSDQTVALSDLLATVAAIFDEELPEDAGEDSKNILPALTGDNLDDPLHQTTIHHSLDGMFALRMGDWKLIEGRGSGGFTDPGRIEPGEGEPEGQLYNMAGDLSEQNNLWNQKEQLVDSLLQTLEKIRKE